MLETLVQNNVRLLFQAVSLLECIGDAPYAGVHPAAAPHRAGGHMRHILEFYECFLEGLEAGVVDYDARRRDLRLEQQRETALARIRLVVSRLLRHTALLADRPLRVRMEAGDHFLASSVGRELQVLASHTVHHFALIALTLRAHGVEVDRDFGMAPSTLRHLARRASEAEGAPCAR